MMAAAAPLLTPQQSNSPGGQAIMGALITCSGLTSRWKWALEFRVPLWCFLTAISAKMRLAFFIRDAVLVEVASSGHSKLRRRRSWRSHVGAGRFWNG